MHLDASTPVKSAGSRVASIAEFDRRARAGAVLTVAFFGGSLTWGANASDPNLTSYRALMGEYLRTKYPKSSFRFIDAAIGGTGSRLGIFRVQRDVLSRDPDLVFLDFTANDDIDHDDVDRLGPYESLLRLFIGQGIPVVQAIFAFKQHFTAAPSDPPPPRAVQHLALAKVYQTGVGNLTPRVRAIVQSRPDFLSEMYPFGNDGAHPDDIGYRQFFEAVRDGFEDAIVANKTCVVPEKPVHSDAPLGRTRIRLTDLPAPRGWKRGKTYRTSMWFDGLSSRWMDDVMIADPANGPVEPLRVEFTGTFVGVFGESDKHAASFRAIVDGKPLPSPDDNKDAWEFASRGNPNEHGRLFKWQELTAQLSPGRHVLEIHPVFDPNVPASQLRIESVCVY